MHGDDPRARTVRRRRTLPGDRTIRFRGAAPLFVVLLLALVPGCGSRSGTAPSGEQAPGRGGTLVVAVRVAPDAANPYVARTHASLELANRTLPRLFAEILPATEEGRVELRPELVVDWTVDPDRRRVELTLRDDARWSDGQPVTCPDLAFTLAAQKDPDLAWAGAEYKQAIESVECPEPHRAVYRFSRPTPYTLMDVNDIHVLPRSIADVPRAEWRRTDWAARLPAAGPFRIAAWRDGAEVVLERNDAYWGAPELPRIDRIVLRAVPETTTLLTQLLAGEVQFASGLDPASARRLEREPAIAVLRRPGWNYVYLGWNTIDPEAYRAWRRGREAACRRAGQDACPDPPAEIARLAREHPHPLFGDARVRRAITLGIDRRQLVDAHLLGAASVPPSPILAPLPEHDPALEPWPYDPDRARRELREAGWLDRDGDGWLERDGRVARFTVYVHAGNRLRRDVALSIKRQLADLGLDMRIEPVESAAFYARLFGRQMDAWIARWRVSARVDMTELFGEAACGTGGANFGCFVDDEAATLAAQARETTDAERRHALWHAWERRFREQQPYTLLFRADLVAAARREVHGIETSQANDALAGVESWWLASQATASGR
ncbi:MAG: peptide-binding protein [Acidobacteriota bacterium]